MGRVSRHKKIKAIDPFSKTGGFVDVDKGKVFNVAPRARDVDAMPKGVAKLIAAQSFVARASSGGGGGSGMAARAGAAVRAPLPPPPTLPRINA